MDMPTFEKMLQRQKDAVSQKDILTTDTGNIVFLSLEKGQELPEHFLPFDSMAFVVAGEGTFILCGETFSVKTSEMLFIPGNEPCVVQANQSFRMLHFRNQGKDVLVKKKPEPEKNPVTEGRAYLRQLLKETKLRDIMSKRVVTVHVDAPFSQVPEKMERAGIRHLPVVDDNDVLVGLVSQRQMFKIQSPRKLMDGSWHYDAEMLNNIILKHVMSKEAEIRTLGPDDSMGEALLAMTREEPGCIPVVDKDKTLKGIVTKHDLLKRASLVYLNVFT